MRRAIITLVVVAVLVLSVAPMALAGVFTVEPANGNGPTATCVGPKWGTPAINGAWNAHFNGAAPDGTSSVIHDLSCPH